MKTVTYGSVRNLNTVGMSDDETKNQGSPSSQDFELMKVNIGDLVVVDYSSKKLKTFYLRVVQEISNNDFFVQYLRRTDVKTFTIKCGDTETIQLNEITKVITNEHFTITLEDNTSLSCYLLCSYYSCVCSNKTLFKIKIYLSIRCQTMLEI